LAFARATSEQTTAASPAAAATFVAAALSINYVLHSNPGNESMEIWTDRAKGGFIGTRNAELQTVGTTSNLYPKSPASAVAQCESAAGESTPGNERNQIENSPANLMEDKSGSGITQPSRIRRVLHSLGLSSLPLPRILTPADTVFDYPEIRAGLRCREADEKKLRSLQKEAISARTSGDHERIRQVFGEISAIAYGEGVTPQVREDFLVRYGCTAWTDDVLEYLVKLAEGRGIAEIGAGNGQWARAINDFYEISHKDAIQGDRRMGKKFEFIIPYDDMTNLPLSPKVYHRFTKPANEYFHPNVQKCTSHTDAVRKWECRGRILMLVYPPPGPMALETVRAYVDVYPEGNDTIVYVGEGRNGANGNDDFFDYFLNDKEWVLLSALDVKPSVGGKGYEKMFVLQRAKSCRQ